MSNGSIPAWAGKPESGPQRAGIFRVYPRVGGETSSCRSRRAVVGGLSPRGRGNRGRSTGSRQLSGSIPAWAGKPHRVAER